MNTTTTPYDKKRIERIIAAELARRFANSVSDEQTEKILEAQSKVNEAQHELRMLVSDCVTALTNRR